MTHNAPAPKAQSLGTLFFTFFKIGLFTFGGGYAMLPILQREVVEKKGWATEEELTDYFAIGQCTPGIIAVNTATFVGHKYRGVSGGVVATLGLVCPSILVILIIARMLGKFKDSPLVQKGLYGLRPASVALVAAAGVSVAEVTLVSLPSIEAGAWSSAVVWPAVALGVVIFIAQRRFPKIHPVAFIVFAGVVGAVFRFPA